MRRLLFLTFTTLITFSCTKNTESNNENQLIFKFQFDPNQARLNNLGQPATIAQGHATQTPSFQEMSVHYIELAPNDNTLLGKGAIVYKSKETNAGGTTAIEFNRSEKAGNNEEFVRLPLKDLPPGTYNWVRASVAYQNYDIKFNLMGIPVIGNLPNQTGRFNSFIGYNTYIKEITPRTKLLTVNGNRAQGFWAFETNLSTPYEAYNKVYFGQAPSGSTTVVNPLFNTSPVPAGSCVVTGKLAEPLIITGEEREDITILLSFSINNSLEWIDDNDNHELDFYGNPNKPNEKIVDMGIRGLEVSIKK
ncbi:MAG: hypothetical protein RIR11_3527 [Bacteroidota bacterium]|jgi:hypothetical protein